MEILRSTDKKSLDRLVSRRAARLEEAEGVVAGILEDVRRHGDRALIRYARKFDGLDLKRRGFVVGRREIEDACAQVPRGFATAVRTAARNIRAAARRQLPRPWRMTDGSGVEVRQIVRPLGRVACYVPGGRFPLPSTVLMSVIPAQVAGVRGIVVTSPKPAPAVLAVAGLLGVKTIFRLGGAQAIAAFAFGTESVPRADKIVGPGNRYVAAAKKLVAGICGIDFVAGPSELVVVACETKADGPRPRWIASDLVAQAEHDPDAVAILITPSRQLALQVKAEVEGILERLRAGEEGGSAGARSSNASNAEASLSREGAIIVTRDLDEAIDVVNKLAPEHLSLVGEAADQLDQVQSAGSIFLGGYSPVAAGDYASGTNHILPTGGVARLRGGLTAADFVKTISVQKLSRVGLAHLSSAIVTLAETEGLAAHAYSVEARFEE